MDYYAADPSAIDFLLEKATPFHRIWECACGAGHLSKRLEELGFDVVSTDLVYRGYGRGGVNFLECSDPFDGDILTNPPYKYAQEFAEKALELVPEGRSVWLFLKITFLEGKKRWELFSRGELKSIYVFSQRISCFRNGVVTKASDSPAVCYAWYRFEKGYSGDTKLTWIKTPKDDSAQETLF